MSAQRAVCVTYLSEPRALAGLVLSMLVNVAKVFLILFLLLLWRLQLLTAF